ncbi:MAG: M23 family metallopeptidase [Nitrospirae bacterium]|uniref:M23 family metallopeptidase n=1 Tax=Candidatus Magnetobacterium casense TaxID=1455061 RepID=UPI0006973114|nr:M23 family metallopeptidase [Candidatus Magnetobacterium casensis]MBF0338752.1 M23 family metallopeptidase [Nitrospirota bacterium]
MKNKRYIIVVISIFVFVMVTALSPTTSWATTAYAFRYPVGDEHGNGWLNNKNGLKWLQGHDYGGNCGSVYHPGIDFNKDDISGDGDYGEPVYAAADGAVVATSTSSWASILITHTLPSGDVVLSLYGHLSEVLVNDGDDVTYGQLIGKVGKTGTPSSHLHFEIRKSNMASAAATSFPCGKSEEWVKERYYDPIAFINNFRYWTGTGSLIRYYARKLQLNGNYAGLNFDIDGIHPGKPAAFFQWQVDATNGCGRLKIDSTGLSDSEKKKVDITMGWWEDRLYDVIFKNQELPVVITHPLGNNVSDGNWNVVMVTFNNTITTTNGRLYAICTTEGVDYTTWGMAFNYPGAGTLYDGTYKWYGNGSIMSDYFENIYDSSVSFGAFKDMVKVKKSDYKPVAFFQWQSWSSRCNRLILTAYNSQGSERSPGVEIKVKGWNAPDSQASGVNTTLPYTIYPSGDWQVIEVKFKNPATEDLTIKASCPGVN